MSSGYTLDAGALIAWERRRRDVGLLLDEALRDREHLVIPAGVLGQVWRNGRKQARLAQLLDIDEVTVVPLDDVAARAAGELCGRTGTSDVIDASVVLCARTRGHAIITSDPEDLARLDPRAELIMI